LHGTVTGLEREIHDTLAARFAGLMESQPNGFLIPISVLKAQNVTTATTGGFLVGTELAAIAPALRAKSVAVAMGATILENLRGHIAASWRGNFNSFHATVPKFICATWTPSKSSLFPPSISNEASGTALVTH